jgi:ankyrin repeat protein
MFRHTPIVRYLLENGASVIIKNNYGWTPLHKVAWQSPPQIAEILISHGAEIDLINIYTSPDAKLPGVEVNINEVRYELFYLATYI